MTETTAKDKFDNLVSELREELHYEYHFMLPPATNENTLVIYYRGQIVGKFEVTQVGTSLTVSHNKLSPVVQQAWQRIAMSDDSSQTAEPVREYNAPEDRSEDTALPNVLELIVIAITLAIVYIYW